MVSYLLFIFKDLQRGIILRKGNLNLKPINIAKIYKNYLEKTNETDLKEIRAKMPEGKIYSASSSGMCSRKIYYKSIEKANKTEEIDSKTLRIFRLGTLIHRDLQDSLEQVKRKVTKENI